MNNCNVFARLRQKKPGKLMDIFDEKSVCIPYVDDAMFVAKEKAHRFGPRFGEFPAIPHANDPVIATGVHDVRGFISKSDRVHIVRVGCDALGSSITAIDNVNLAMISTG